jgi:NAD-dependent dihydropyrimidine dehydrogenase PreA subunit
MGSKILFCNCGGERISRERLIAIEKSLELNTTELIKVSDLCGIIALQKDMLTEFFSLGAKILIIGCHSRSMKLLLEQAGVDIKSNSFHFINFLELSDEDILLKVSEFCNINSRISSFKKINGSSDWPSWFPVIDYSRCSNCGQCADFCLFGVYEKGENSVRVINPQKCKNNCPACARICPQTAIVFPKYKIGGAIGGSDITDEISEQKRQASDINLFLEGDIYNALEQRKHKRKSIISDEAMKKAFGERDDALNIIIK